MRTIIFFATCFAIGFGCGLLVPAPLQAPVALLMIWAWEAVALGWLFERWVMRPRRAQMAQECRRKREGAAR